MNLKSLKKWIIISIIVIFILLLIIFVINTINKSKKPDSIFKQNDEDIHYDTIEFVEYNEITPSYISDMQMCNIYLLDYKNNAINYPEIAYELLDKEYREKRFKNLQGYKDYVNSNLDKLYQIKLSQYQIKQENDGNRYICIDQFGNYYIFKETFIMKYTVILDTYTTELPEYKEKYNTSNETQKIALCIDRFIQAVNDENYNFAYSVLSDSFKNNYFKTQESFIQYVKQYLLGRDQIEYTELKNEGTIYKCTVNLKNSTNAISKTFILQLKDETNFELAFNIK